MLRITNENGLYIKNKLLNKMNKEGLSKEEYRVLQILLFAYNKNLEDNYPVCKTTLNGNKIMFIADTHFGECKENVELVDFSYNKAARENIKTVVHLGDLIDGPLYNNGITAEKLKEQIAIGMEHMPDDIITKLLIGNHDFYALKRFDGIWQLYFNNPKLEILGMKCVVVNWNDFINIGLYHEINALTTKNPSCVDLYLQGHYHVYYVDEYHRCITVPTLGYSIIDAALIKSGLNIRQVQSALVVASIEDESTALFKLYDSEDNIQEEVTYDVKTHTLRKL